MRADDDDELYICISSHVFFHLVRRSNYFSIVTAI